MSFIEKLNFTAWDTAKLYKTVNAGGVADFVVATNGKIYRCILNNTALEPSANPTEWLELVFGSEIGAVMPWTTDTEPAGWLPCEGGSYLVATYPTLYSVIGYTYGGAGANFNVPDYRGRFLRGWDNTAGIDPNAGARTNRGDGTTGDNVGTKQAHAFNDHVHTHSEKLNDGTVVNGRYGWVNGDDIYGVFDLPTEGSPTGGAETRPVNINVLYIIKYA